MWPAFCSSWATGLALHVWKALESEIGDATNRGSSVSMFIQFPKRPNRFPEGESEGPMLLFGRSTSDLSLRPCITIMHLGRKSSAKERQDDSKLG